MFGDLESCGEICPSIGKTISHCRILERLEGGAMAIVYCAKDLRLERAATLKFC